MDKDENKYRHILEEESNYSLITAIFSLITFIMTILIVIGASIGSLYFIINLFIRVKNYLL